MREKLRPRCWRSRVVETDSEHRISNDPEASSRDSGLRSLCADGRHFVVVAHSDVLTRFARPDQIANLLANQCVVSEIREIRRRLARRIASGQLDRDLALRLPTPRAR